MPSILNNATDTDTQSQVKKDRLVLVEQCHELIHAYETGLLGDTTMPEDSHPDYKQMSVEQRLSYYTLPMALNYQRDSFKLWEAAKKTFEDKETEIVFDVVDASRLSTEQLQSYLMRYKLALQPNKHINTWMVLSNTFSEGYSGIHGFFKIHEFDFLKIRETMQVVQKKSFPYLSGPKIFNYWSYIIQQYGGIELNNSEFIEIAPDTHVTQASVKLGVISEAESKSISKPALNGMWREILSGTDIDPIDLHSPLWFWSRNKFQYILKT